MTTQQKFLMCTPTHFAVEYVINPWMDGNIGRAQSSVALQQWTALRDIVSRHAQVEIIEPGKGLPDMPFTANGGLLLGDIFVPSRFYYAQRKPEVDHHREWFRRAGIKVVELGSGGAFEGEGDALFQHGTRRLWAGYGVRTALESHRDLSEIFEVEVCSLRLVDRRFYHLDTCFAPLPDGAVMYYPAAFDHASLNLIKELVPAEKRIEVSDADAMGFSCNAVVAGNTVIMNQASDSLRATLSARGLTVETTPLSEFMLAGGAAKCLSLKLDQPVTALQPGQTFPSHVCERVVEVEGHILDNGQMNQILDTIAESGGSFAMEHFSAGLRHDMTSVARVRVFAPDEARLSDLMAHLLQLGAHPVEGEQSALLVTTDMDGVVPDNFYSSTIYPTDVRIDGEWLRVERQRMDAVIVVDGKTPRCTLFRNVKAGDRVVCGHDGIRIHNRKTRSNDDEDFSFMSSGVSSERRVEATVEQIAWEMQRIRSRNGRIVITAGPVVIHTGGGPALSTLIRNGYVQALLAGNALAVHDIEHSFFGTSLGVDLRAGHGVHEGHRHHLRSINRIRRSGSIAAAVAEGTLTSGVMYDCVKANVPFSLAGSIRDDGPLPDTEMDLVEAQRAYSELLRGADLVLLLSSMLHAIGVGNMTPAGVRLICVDISPAVVTKLADRGSLESVGVVTDVGLFLKLLVNKLGLDG